MKRLILIITLVFNAWPAHANLEVPENASVLSEDSPSLKLANTDYMQVLSALKSRFSESDILKLNDCYSQLKNGGYRTQVGDVFSYCTTKIFPKENQAVDVDLVCHILSVGVMAVSGAGLVASVAGLVAVHNIMKPGPYPPPPKPSGGGKCDNKSAQLLQDSHIGSPQVPTGNSGDADVAT